MTFTSINYLNDGLIITTKQSIHYEDITATHLEPDKLPGKVTLRIHERGKSPLVMILDKVKAIEITNAIQKRIKNGK